jgi:hypothetical protein
MLYCCTAVFTVLVKEDRVIDMPNTISLWIMMKYKVGWVEVFKSEMVTCFVTFTAVISYILF